MKHARCRLLLAAALWLTPQAALSQPKRPNGKTPAAAPATAPAPAAAGATEIDLDEPAKPSEPKPDDAKPGAPAGEPSGLPAAGTTGGICEIDPTACPKAGDLKALGARSVAADVYAVQQIYALRRGRFELNPYWSVSVNDQFVTHPGPGLAANYYLTNVFAIGVNGTYYQPFNSDADFNFQNRRATRLAVPLTEYLAGFAVNATYVPIYGKFAGFADLLFHYDGYFVGGVGGLFTRPIAVIDPDNRKFDYEFRPAANVGFGLRVFVNRWFSVIGEVRDYLYFEQLENTQVAKTRAEQQNRSTWFGEKPLTNNVQAQIGVSIFLPFSWEYRLPK